MQTCKTYKYGKFKIQYIIGNEYRYPNKRKKFKLSEVKGFVFKFKCGHWISDCVFMDLIDCNTGIQISENTQLKIF